MGIEGSMNRSSTVPTQADMSREALRQRRTSRREPFQPGRRAYTLREFCEVYATSRSQAYVEIAAGRLRVRKVGRRTLIDTDDAEDWWAARAVGSAA